jgi:hypothetical protein
MIHFFFIYFVCLLDFVVFLKVEAVEGTKDKNIIDFYILALYMCVTMRYNHIRMCVILR